ncbi:hypothetical protein K2173_015494 [Erythroxylum novogranatense]|uniref:Uncharacterized protein n=1 Tax=Erythroxylum novogranatense TaxID=1862640 RepID=A0AAV8SRU7_9ROSI|nr:hypothetical protein K2173_015494 [Erythroxylum novogranatense]
MSGSGLAGVGVLHIFSEIPRFKLMLNELDRTWFHLIVNGAFAPFFLIYSHFPKMTVSTFVKILLLSLLDLYFLGMKNTTTTSAAAVITILLAFTFVMACIARLQKVNIRAIHSYAKVVGTIVTVAGAMIMTLIRGPLIDLFHSGETNLHNLIKGILMITTMSFSKASFMILQMTWICLFGTIEGSIVALIMQRVNANGVYIGT